MVQPNKRHWWLWLVLIGMAWPGRPTSAKTGWLFRPPQRLFPLRTADPQETHLGIFRYLNKNNLEGLIGYSFEALQGNFASTAPFQSLQIGLHAQTASLLKQHGTAFPLDAIDFLFALHLDARRAGAIYRFSFGHISAHFADGHDPLQEGRAIVYSREFFAWTASYRWPGIEIYSGVTWVYHTIPDLPPWQLQLGGEWHLRLLTRSIQPYLAYDLKSGRDGDHRLRHSGQLGLKWYGRKAGGFRLALLFHRGPSEHGQYHNRQDDYWGLGVFFDP